MPPSSIAAKASHHCSSSKSKIINCKQWAQVDEGKNIMIVFDNNYQKILKKENNIFFIFRYLIKKFRLCLFLKNTKKNNFFLCLVT